MAETQSLWLALSPKGFGLLSIQMSTLQDEHLDHWRVARITLSAAAPPHTHPCRLIAFLKLVTL